MKTGLQNVAIEVAPPADPQQDAAKTSRKTLKDLQRLGDKENQNLAGRPQTTTNTKPTDLRPKKTAIKKLKLVHKSIQTEPTSITIEDLTDDEPSEDYWRRLAEKRGDALNDSLQENERLKESFEALQEEHNVTAEMLSEAQELVSILKDMINEDDDEEKEEDKENDDVESEEAKGGNNEGKKETKA